MSANSQWLWMQNTFGTGTRRAHEVCERYGPPDELLTLSGEQLEQEGFLTRQEMRAVLSPDLALAERMLAAAREYGATVLTPDQDEYPDSFRNIHAMPLVLYAMGDYSLLREHYLITMVGTRRPDEYGLAAARKLSGEIAQLGGVVVSGLAVGTDTACHRGALEANGKTIAFLAAGLDADYPARNRTLRGLIEKDGLVLTEYPLGALALPGHFAVRNRLLSGVSMATVIVQSRRYSGTMLTAAHALAQNRDLFAVPGSIFEENMAGCNALLSEGAAPALSGADVLLRYPPIYGYPLVPTQPQAGAERRVPPEPVPPAAPHRSAAIEVPDYLSQRQAAVLRCLLEGPVSVDDLSLRTQLPVPALLAIVTQLEIFGLVEMMPGRMLSASARTIVNT